MGGNRSQCFVAQLSPSRQWDWALGGTGYADTQVYGLAYTPTGSLWVGGYGPTGTVVGPVVLAAPGLRYVGFAGQLSATGQWGTVQQLSPQGSGSSILGTVRLDAAGNLVLVGIVLSTGSGPTTATLGQHTVTAAPDEVVIFVTSLAPTGQWQYARPQSQLTGTNPRMGFQNTALSPSGLLYLTGILQGTLQVGRSTLRNTYSFPGTDAILLQFDPRGALATQTRRNGADLSLWPNPAAGRVQVRVAAGPATSLVVLDALGQEVRHHALPAQATSALLDLNGLPAGLYTVRLGSSAGKLVVE